MRKIFKKIFSTSNTELQEEPMQKLTKYKELEEAWNLFSNQKFLETIALAKQFVDSSKKGINYESKKLIGLSNFRLGKYNESQMIFKELAENSKNPDDWFNLVTSSTLNLDLEQGQSAFTKAVEYYKQNGKKENISIPNMIFYYMQCLKDVKEYRKAFSQLYELTGIYTELKITDGTFLYLRGVPFFEQTIDASKEILENIDKEEVKMWIEHIKENVDNDGQNYVWKFEKGLNYAS